MLDGAHTPAAAAALAATLRRAFPDAALALVVGMAADKDAAGVMAALRQAAPVAIAFTQAPIAGGLARCASMAQLHCCSHHQYAEHVRACHLTTAERT